MFGSSILEVVIGLVFIYLLYSLLATTVKEGMATILALRAKMLKKAIGRMLDDGFNKPFTIATVFSDVLNTFRNLFRNLFFFFFPLRVKRHLPTKLVDLFYDQPGIKYLGENVVYKSPSYISPQAFSKAVIDTLKDIGAVTADDSNDFSLIYAGIQNISDANETKKFILSLLRDANNDITRFTALLEIWFNETMNRTTGWYKRQAQLIIFAIGLTFAFVFNVDTLFIVKKLSKDKDARQSLVDLATSYVNNPKDTLKGSASRDSAKAVFHYADSLIKGDIQDANALIAIGWNIPSRFKHCNIHKGSSDSKSEAFNCEMCLKGLQNKDTLHPYVNLTAWHKVKYMVCMATSRPRKMLGYLITAVAVSLGAPFWFELLNKLVDLRGTGKKPEEIVAK
jgi:hypothetical protein